MQLYTARYASKAAAAAVATGKLFPVSISNGGPRFPTAVKAKSKLEVLCPPWALVQSARAGKLLKDGFQREYFAHLDKVGVDTITHEIAAAGEAAKQAGAEGVVFLCFEDLSKPDEWCHRRMFATWWLKKTGEAVGEWPELAKPAPAQGRLL